MSSWAHRHRRRASIALRESQWLLPFLGAVVGALLALALGGVDRNPDPGDWAVTVDRARDTMMSTLGILFAGLAIVLSLATMTAQTVAGRFSLRLLRVHLRGAANKIVIAIFTMTTTFLVIEQMRMVSLDADDLAPRTSVFVSGVLLIVSGLAIIWHISFTLQSIRVDRTIRRVGASTARTARAVDRRWRHYDLVPPSELQGPSNVRTLAGSQSGYLAGVDADALLAVAERHDVVICIRAEVGDHILSGEPVGWLAPTGAN